MSTLYVVATPIGNLEDMTFRAVRVLHEVAWIACEDTRQSRKLLDHYEIKTPLISYHDHNELERAKELSERLKAGDSGALISDAGMPLVSDPGYRLVRAAIESGIEVQPIPGASASLTALAASGLPTDSFHFLGFLPAKSGQRVHLLESLRNEKSTLIFYEAPHRLLETLADIERVMGARPVVVAREMTKIHEEFLRGTAGQILDQLKDRPPMRGEITLLVGKSNKPVVSNVPIEQAVETQINAGLSRMDAMKAIARERGVSKREIYKRLAIPPAGPNGGPKRK
jgi:16S rRNA (cytidine1402-2'-O)-methyltransferase